MSNTIPIDGVWLNSRSSCPSVPMLNPIHSSLLPDLDGSNALRIRLSKPPVVGLENLSKTRLLVLTKGWIVLHLGYLHTSLRQGEVQLRVRDHGSALPSCGAGGQLRVAREGEAQLGVGNHGPLLVLAHGVVALCDLRLGRWEREAQLRIGDHGSLLILRRGPITPLNFGLGFRKREPKLRVGYHCPFLILTNGRVSSSCFSFRWQHEAQYRVRDHRSVILGCGDLAGRRQSEVEKRVRDHGCLCKASDSNQAAHQC